MIRACKRRIITLHNLRLIIRVIQLESSDILQNGMHFYHTPGHSRVSLCRGHVPRVVTPSFEGAEEFGVRRSGLQDPLVNLYVNPWKDPPCSMGKSTITIGKLPELWKITMLSMGQRTNCLWLFSS